jgi:hypothetical protein
MIWRGKCRVNRLGQRWTDNCITFFMAPSPHFESFFKPEIQSSGNRLFAEDKVSVSSGSDTEIHAYVRASPPLKVHFSSAGIESQSFTAECSCPSARKGRFCKHIWATLLGVEQRYPDFLSAKKSVEQPTAETEAETPTPAGSAREAARLRASEYRKEQYQKQKSRAKELKQKGRMPKTSPGTHALPTAVEEALAYFSLNGFPMADGPSEAIINEAKRTLSRVFHPDRGGSHAEITELNRKCELLRKYVS